MSLSPLQRAAHLLSHLLLKQLVPLIIFAGFLVLYVSTATHGYIVGGAAESESMELQRAAVYNGIAHATGYPAYVLLAYPFSRIGALLGGDPFTWVTYFSAFTTALGLTVVYALLRLWFKWPAALIATCVFGLSGVLWHIATITEVQGLEFVIVMGIIYLVARYRREPQRTVLLEGAALLFGLGLANHRITVLAAPSIALVVLWVRFWRYLKPWDYVRIITAMGFPLLAYYDIFIKSATKTVYGLGTTWDHGLNGTNTYNTLAVVFGYGQEGLIVFPSNDFIARFRLVVGNHLEFITPALVVIGLIGLLVFARKDLLVALTVALFSVVGVLFFMSWRQDGKGQLYYWESMLALIFGIAAVADIAVTLSPKLAQLIPWEQLRQLKQINAVQLAIPVSLFIPILFAIQLPINNRSTDNTGQIYYDDFLRLPQNSIVFTGGWAPDQWIGQEAVLKRTDIFLSFSRDTKDFVDNALHVPRPIYLSRFQQLLLGMLSGSNPLLDYGVVFSGTDSIFIQIGPHVNPALNSEAEKAVRVDKLAAPGIRLYSYSVYQDANGAHFTLYWRADQKVTVDYHPFTHLRQVDGNGNIVALLSQRDFSNPVEGYYPTHYWQAGETVKDTYTIPWPAGSLPSPQYMRWAFGFTAPDTGQRLSDIMLPYEIVGGAK